MKNILIIHRYFWPENISNTPLMLADIVDYHILKNDNIHICCGSINDFKKERDIRFNGNISIISFRSNIDRNLIIFKRIINIFRLLNISLKTINKNNLDIIYIISYPPFLSIFILFFKDFLKKKYNIIFLLQDNFSYRFKFPLLKKIYNYCLQKTILKSLFTVVISEAMRDYILKNNNNQNSLNNKMHLLRNYNIDPIVKEIPNKEIDIIYAGNHGKAQNLYYFLKSLTCLSDMKLRIDFYGEGQEKQRLIKFATNSNLNINFYESIQRKEILKEIRKSKFSLIPTSPELLNYGYPSKLLTYLAAGSTPLFILDKPFYEIKWLMKNKLALILPQSNYLELASKLKYYLNNYSLDKKLINHKLLSNALLTKEIYFKEFDRIYRKFT